MMRPAKIEPGVVITRESPAHARALASLGLDVLCPILKSGRPIAALGLGGRADGRPYAGGEMAFLESVAACSATPIENGLIYDELKRLNQRLSVKVFQLHNLFDVSRELTSTFDEDAIQGLVTTTLMGHLMVSRCALYRAREGRLVLAHARGLGGHQRHPRAVEEGEAQVGRHLFEPAANGIRVASDDPEQGGVGPLIGRRPARHVAAPPLEERLAQRRGVAPREPSLGYLAHRGVPSSR